MTKFDSYLTQITETNNITPAVATQKPGTTPIPNQTNTTPQTPATTQTQAAPQTTPVPQPSQQKLDVNKLIKDFNDNIIKVQTPKDLEKYGITLPK